MPQGPKRALSQLPSALIVGLCAVTVAHAQQAASEETAPLPGLRPPGGIELAQAPYTGAMPATTGTGAPPERASAPWRIAPIRWGGSVGLDWRRASLDGGVEQSQINEVLDLRGASYVWQPWFMQVTSSLSLAAGRSRSDGGNAGFVTSSKQSSSMRSTTGALGVSLFPMSRFPFNGTYTSADSRTSEILTTSDTRTERLSLRQSYRTVSGAEQYLGSYDRSTLDSASFGTDTVDVLSASYSRRADPHQFDANATHARNARSSDTGGSTQLRVALNHSYRGDEAWQYTSSFSDSSISLRTGTGDNRMTGRTGFRQLNTMATWTPESERPLHGTAAFRWAETSSENSGQGIEATHLASRAISGTGSLMWRPTDQLHVSGSASLTQFATGDQAQTTVSEMANANYLFDPIPIAGFSYVPSLSGSLGHSAGGIVGTRIRSSAGFHHSLLRTMAFGERTSVSSSLSQGLNAVTETEVGASYSLSHNFSLSARHTTESGVNGYAGLSLADNRMSGATEGSFQMANLQFSGQIPFSRYASASANLTVQSSRQDVRLTPEQQALEAQLALQEPWRRTLFENTARWRTQSSGGATYQHARLFGVPRLRYTANLTVYNQQVETRLLGDLNAPRENIAWSHEQRLDYTIGRIDLRLTFRMAEVDGKKNALVFVRLIRSFGGF